MKTDGTELARLDRYLAGELSDEEAERVEEELFADGELAEAAAFLDRVTESGARLAAGGTFDPSATGREVDALMQSGRRCFFFEFTAEQREWVIQLPRWAEIFVYKFAFDTRGWDRFDLEMAIPGQGTVKTMPDLRFDPADGALYGVCEAELAQASYQHRVRTRLIGHRGGERHVISETDVRGELVD